MSDESSPQQEPRLKLKLQPDKAPAQPVTPPAEPAAPAPPLVPPASPPSGLGAAAATPDKPPQKLRMSFTPFETPKSAPPIPASWPPIPVAPSTAAAGDVPAETPETAPEKVKVKVRVDIKPMEPEPSAGSTLPVETGVTAEPPVETEVEAKPPVGEEKTEEGHKLKLKPKEPPTRQSSEETPAEIIAAAIQRASTPSLYTPPPVVEVVMEVPPLLSTAVRRKPQPWRLHRVELVIGIVGLLVSAAVVYLTYRNFVTRPAEAPLRPEVAPAPEAVITPNVLPAPPAATLVPRLPGSGAPKSAMSPTLSGRNSRLYIFIDQLKVGGVRMGPPPRLFIEGLTYKPGDVIDQRLGIIFVGVNVSTKELVFKDRTGAVVRRRY